MEGSNACHWASNREKSIGEAWEARLRAISIGGLKGGGKRGMGTLRIRT
jgi:hypothetical protein